MHQIKFVPAMLQTMFSCSCLMSGDHSKQKYLSFTILKPIFQTPTPSLLDVNDDRTNYFSVINNIRSAMKINNQLEMSYLNTIEQQFLSVEQLDLLEVCLPYSRLLAGILILAVFQNLRWNSNETSLCNIYIQPFSTVINSDIVSLC